MKFTKQQLADWQAYKRVRKSGKWNMFDHEAQIATGLADKDYDFVMDNFEALRDAKPKPTQQTNQRRNKVL
jgi:hypothetical protein